MGREIQSRAGVVVVNRITADVAQAVEGLREGLAHIDRLDSRVAEAKSDAVRDGVRVERARAHAALKKKRAELDALLLGDDDA